MIKASFICSIFTAERNLTGQKWPRAKAVDYKIFELLLASGDLFGALKKGEGKEFFDQYAEQAIQTIKKLEQQLS